MTTNAEVLARIEARSIPVTESGCWLWLGWVNAKGYGRMYARGTNVGAHRFAWSAVNGSIPAGLYVCHKCDTPSCVNPAHLFLGTPTDNNHDMVAKKRQGNIKKAICKWGHVLDELNTYVYVRKDTGRTFRTCRVCHNKKSVQHKARKRLTLLKETSQ